MRTMIDRIEQLKQERDRIQQELERLEKVHEKAGSVLESLEELIHQINDSEILASVISEALEILGVPQPVAEESEELGSEDSLEDQVSDLLGDSSVAAQEPELVAVMTNREQVDAYLQKLSDEAEKELEGKKCDFGKDYLLNQRDKFVLDKLLDNGFEYLGQTDLECDFEVEDNVAPVPLREIQNWKLFYYRGEDCVSVYAQNIFLGAAEDYDRDTWSVYFEFPENDREVFLNEKLTECIKLVESSHREYDTKDQLSLELPEPETVTITEVIYSSKNLAYCEDLKAIYLGNKSKARLESWRNFLEKNFDYIRCTQYQRTETGETILGLKHEIEIVSESKASLKPVLEALENQDLSGTYQPGFASERVPDTAFTGQFSKLFYRGDFVRHSDQSLGICVVLEKDPVGSSWWKVRTQFDLDKNVEAKDLRLQEYWDSLGECKVFYPGDLVIRVDRPGSPALVVMRHDPVSSKWICEDGDDVQYPFRSGEIELAPEGYQEALQQEKEADLGVLDQEIIRKDALERISRLCEALDIDKRQKERELPQLYYQRNSLKEMTTKELVDFGNRLLRQCQKRSIEVAA